MKKLQLKTVGGVFKADAVLDPCDQFRDAKVEKLLDALGFLPDFLTRKSDSEDVQACFQREYIYGGWSPMRDPGNVDEKGILLYPEDPPLYPLIQITFKHPRTQTVYIYQHAMVSIVEESGSFEVSRLD